MAIYEYKYRGFRGRVATRTGRILTVFLAEFAFRMKNPWMITLLVLTLALGVFPSVLMMNPGFFLVYLFFWSTIYASIAGGDILAADRKYNTLTLYFSRPITKEDYMAGKFLTMFATVSLVTLLPCLIIIAMIYGIQTSGSDTDVDALARGFIILGILWALLYTAIPMGFSASTTNKWFASAGTFAFMFFSSTIALVFAQFIHRDLGYMSILNDMLIVLAGYGELSDGASYYIPELAVLSMLVMSVGFLGWAYLQVKKLDLSE